MPPDAFCYLFLSITVSSLFVQAQENTQYDLLEKSHEKRVSKREAAIFIDNFPIIQTSRHMPSVIYRRVSKQRYRSPKPKYGPPVKIYRSSKPRIPFKKYIKTVKPKYGPPSYKKRPTRTNYGPPKLLKNKPVYGPPKKVPHSSYYDSGPDFGEPPKEYVSNIQALKQHFGEPPTDSYGTPLHTAANEPHVSDYYSVPTSFSDPPTSLDNVDTFGQELDPWQSFQSNQYFDNSYAYSKRHPVFIKPESFAGQEVEVDSTSYADIRPHKDSLVEVDSTSYADIRPYKDSLVEVDSTSYADIRPYKDSLVEREPLPFKKKRRPFYESVKSWRPPKQSKKPKEVLVGGRYAEPPARYVNKVKSAASLYTDEDELSSNEFIDPDVALSATSSSYVNYKNSNMAFSPQNLNDAFSIVDK